MVVGLSLTTQACIVSSSREFAAADDCAPYFVNTGADPAFGVVTIFDLRTKPNPQLPLSIPVRSCATTVQLEGRIFIDNGAKGIFPAPVAVTGKIDRTATFTVPLSGLDARCHRVEWRVTRRFSLDDLKTSAAPGDLALFAWYVDITNDGNAHAIDSCPVGE